jgi:hypothetical protein
MRASWMGLDMRRSGDDAWAGLGTVLGPVLGRCLGRSWDGAWGYWERCVLLRRNASYALHPYALSLSMHLYLHGSFFYKGFGDAKKTF